MRVYNCVFLLSLLSFTVSAQPSRVSGSGERVLLIVPMTGVGSWAEPRRPSIPRDAGLAFHYVLSDDGNMAIVEATALNPVKSQQIEAALKQDSRVKVFRPSKDKRADVETEIRKLKKDFDLDSFGKGPAAPAVNTPR
jgi:hypothetical protein